MTSILEKDGAVIITVENPSVKEKELIRQAKALNSGESTSSVFSKFKCNKSKLPSADEKTAAADYGSLDDFVEIYSPDDVPF